MSQVAQSVDDIDKIFGKSLKLSLSEQKRKDRSKKQAKKERWIKDELIEIYLRLKMKRQRDSNNQTINSYIEEKEELDLLSIPILFDYIKHAIQIFLEMHELASENQDKSNCKYKLKE